MAIGWKATTWFIEADISDCFGSFDHQIMLSTLAESIHDNRFLRLMHNMLRAGYLEDWVWDATLSGVPQGGVASPILSSIYLHKLDQFVETVLIPEYSRGTHRAGFPPYERVKSAIKQARARGDRAKVRQLRQQLRSLPSRDPFDPGYRRLKYVRYADDHLLGFIGPKNEAEQIKARLTQFLRDDLKLELSQEKTLITHARTGAARFLGYEITVYHADHMITNDRRTVNGKIGLRVPLPVIKTQCAPYLTRGKPAHRPDWTNRDDHAIVATYGAKYRGIVQYYLLAADVWRLNRLQWVMQTSMLKTLAAKHQSTVSKMAARHRTKISTTHGLRTCFEARVERVGRNPLVARFGGIPSRRQRYAVINDRAAGPTTHPQKELVTRLLKGRCELCEKRTREAQVHHVRTLADLTKTGQSQPAWAAVMTKMRRKALIVCPPCHDHIHSGPTTHPLTI